MCCQARTRWSDPPLGPNRASSADRACLRGTVPAIAERAIHFVGRYVVEAKCLRFLRRQMSRHIQGGLQHHVRANQVRLPDFPGSIDPAIDVAFRRQMQDPIRLEILEGLRPPWFPIADVAADEFKSGPSRATGASEARLPA